MFDISKYNDWSIKKSSLEYERPQPYVSERYSQGHG